MADRMSEPLGKREFLKRVTAACGTSVCLPSLLSALSGCGGDTPTGSDRIEVNVAGYPALGAPGGAAKVTSAGINDGKPLIVVRVSDTSFLALSSVCTHEGCEVGIGTSELQCPCHGSRFRTADGTVLGGPASRALARFDTSYDAASGVLTIG